MSDKLSKTRLDSVLELLPEEYDRPYDGAEELEASGDECSREGQLHT